MRQRQVKARRDKDKTRTVQSISDLEVAFLCFTEILLHKMNEQGMTRDDLAQKVGLPLKLIDRLFRDGGLITFGQAADMARAVGCQFAPTFSPTAFGVYAEVERQTLPKLAVAFG